MLESLDYRCRAGQRTRYTLRHTSNARSSGFGGAMPEFQLLSDFKPTGDQPQAIDQLARGINSGLKHQALLGVTGSGKSVIASTPMLVRRGRWTSCEPIGPFIDEL